MNWQEFCKMMEESGAVVTFSRNCISGLVSDCGCWRCRKSAGLEVTEETEKSAEERSVVESRKFRDVAVSSLVPK